MFCLYSDDIWSNAPINGLPQHWGGVEGNPREIDIFSFQMSISPPLGLHFESNSHLWGELKGTHNSLYCSTERLQREIITWWQNNGTHKLCVLPQV